MTGEFKAGPRLPQPAADELYAELIEAMRAMDDQEALRFSARLVLLLMSRLDDPKLVRAAIRAAAEPSPRPPA
jgi:uncharacterized protein (DUF1778 family)